MNTPSTPTAEVYAQQSATESYALLTGALYSCPSGLGIVTHTIGAPRQI